MKRFLALFLCVVLIFSLAACGNDNTNNSNVSENSSTQSEDKVSGNTSDSDLSDTTSQPSSQTSSNTSSNTSSKTSSNKSSNTSSITSSQSFLKEGTIDKAMHPKTNKDVYSNKIVRYELNSECKGWYFTPKEEGNYQTIILIHGQGNPYSFRDNLVYNFNKWVKEGYIEPMVVVIPEVLNTYGPTDKGSSNIDDFQYYIYEAYPNRFNALLKSIERGTLTSKIDTSKKPFVAGFSMGGMAALHAGADYNTRIDKVGALSPGKSFYLGDGNWGFYNYAKDIHFSTAPGALVYLSAGRAEKDFSNVKGAFVTTINTYERGIKVNNSAILTKFIAPESWGEHGFQLAQMEIFMFLHLAFYDALPTNAFVESACAQPWPSAAQVPTVVTDPNKEHG